MGMLFGGTSPAPINLRDLYFNTPMSAAGITAPKPTISDRLAAFVSSGLQKAGISHRTAQRFGDKITGAADALTPLGAASSAQQAGRDYRAGNYGSAAANAVGALLSAIPDGGALTAKGAGVLHSIIAPLWHGSPHAFEKFALEKIGTGAGGQVYAPGLNFSESKDIAEGYRKLLGSRERFMDVGGRLIGRDSPTEYAAADLAHLANQYEPDILAEHGSVARWAQQDLVARGISDRANAMQLFNQFRKGGVKEAYRHGHLYEARLNAQPEDFPQWEQLASDDAGRMAAASNLMQSGSAPGIKHYADEIAPNGTRNYVVFDPSIISILNRH